MVSITWNIGLVLILRIFLVSSALTQPEAISNLEMLFKPFKSHRCLNVITSFKTVDILGLKTPVMLRQLLPEADRQYKRYFRWYPDYNVTRGSGQLNCTSFKLFRTDISKDYHDFRQYCSEIFISSFASASKPWECEVEINLFLILRMTSSYGHSYVDRQKLYYPGAIEYYTRAPLSSKTYFFVDNLKSGQHQNYKNVCRDILYGRRSRRLYFFDDTNRHLVGKFLLVSLKRYMDQDHLVSWSLGPIFAFENCDNLRGTEAQNILEVFTTIMKASEPLHLWNANFDRDGYRHSSYQSAMKQCLTKDLWNLLTSKDGNAHHLNRVPHVQAYIMETILKNFSLEIDDNTICDCTGGKMSIRHVSRKSYRHPNKFVVTRSPVTTLPFLSLFYFNDTSRSLRFATSKTRGSSSLPFQELYNVFQPEVWVSSFIILVISGCFVAHIVGLTRSNGKLFQQIVSVTKSVLEQGDPFLASVCNHSQLKMVVMGVLTASMLLSNAYKNNNVYNMVVPRKELMFERLSELETDNFSIYARLNSVFYSFYPYNFEFWHREKGSILPNLTFFEGFGYESMTSTFRVYAKNELQQFTELNPEYENPDGGLRNFARLIKLATVPDKTLQLIRSSTDEQTQFPFNISKQNATLFADQLSQLVFKLEHKMFQQELLGNEKIAVILPVSVALQFKIKARSQSKDVFIGKETYASGVLALDIWGDVHFSMLKRIWAMQVSGIIDWLHRMFDPISSLEDTSQQVVGAAKISGNILVIFVLWTIGLLTSTVTFLNEIFWTRSTKTKMKQICLLSVTYVKNFRGEDDTGE